MEYEKYVQEITKWAENRGFQFIQKRSLESGRFIEFQKNNYRFEVWEDHIVSPLLIMLVDYTNATYEDGENGYVGWVGKRFICSFSKPISKELFDELCNHHGL